jgi:hypothetical protein
MKKLPVITLAIALAGSGCAFAASSSDDAGSSHSGKASVHQLGADLRGALHKIGDATRNVVHRAGAAVHRNGSQRDHNA